MVIITRSKPDHVPGLIDQFQKAKSRKTSNKIRIASKNLGLNNLCKSFMLTGVFS